MKNYRCSLAHTQIMRTSNEVNNSLFVSPSIYRPNGKSNVSCSLSESTLDLQVPASWSIVVVVFGEIKAPPPPVCISKLHGEALHYDWEEQ